MLFGSIEFSAKVLFMKSYCFIVTMISQYMSNDGSLSTKLLVFFTAVVTSKSFHFVLVAILLNCAALVLRIFAQISCRPVSFDFI